MSVDTYARKRNYSAYQAVRHGGVEVLVARTLMAQASAVRVELRRFLMFKWLSVQAELRGHET